jgi:hypothetical protein
VLAYGVSLKMLWTTLLLGLKGKPGLESNSTDPGKEIVEIKGVSISL